jgi:hypothetical protein
MGTERERGVDWGPFVSNLEPAERLARLRSLRALAGVFCHRHPELAVALRAAERDLAALEAAALALEQVPTVNRRRLLASYADLERASR